MVSKPKDDNPADKGPEQDPVEPKITDKRRVDPETGEARPGTQAPAPSGADANAEITEEDLKLLADAERDLVAEYRDRAARAEAELKNFRTRVERDRAANREMVIADVLRNLLPVIDDLDRADAHGDLVDGAPLTLVAQKLRAGFERYGVIKVGAKDEPFDPKLHEAIVQVYSAEVKRATIADVIEPGYALGERLLRPAKVAVSVPEP